MTDEPSFLEQCKRYLEERWTYVCGQIDQAQTAEFLDSLKPELMDIIAQCLTSRTKTYHYVLPTQLLTKCVNHDLDCHSIQTAYGKRGAFDARTIAHGVVVPFDKANYNVLGGSSEPYVNNPLRCPAVTREFRGQQKNKTDWDRLIEILDYVESQNDKNLTASVFDQVLREIYKLLSGVHVRYPTPNRISLNGTINVITRFTTEKSGGDRVESVCTALFRIIAEQFDLFDEVRRQKVNVADASSGMGADIECWLRGKVILLVEVKDRALTVIQLDSKLEVARSRKISEILFIAEQGIEREDKEQAEKRIRDEFISGQNIYVSNFIDFSTGILILLGEKGRVQFLTEIGGELDRVNPNVA
jgi:hypothetical protein